MTVNGIDELMETVELLRDSADTINKAGLYDGAGLMAQKMTEAVGEIPDRMFMFASYKTELPQRIGIAPFVPTKDGWETAISYDGYLSAGVSKVHPLGFPAIELARAINTGTERFGKYPFVRKLVNSAREACEQAIADACEKKISQILSESEAE